MASETAKPKIFYGYVVVLVSFLTLVLMTGAGYSFGIFFKPLSTEFGWTRAMTSGAFSLFLALAGFLSIFTGRLNDRFGPRLIMTICGLLVGSGYLLMSQISTIWHLYLFYGVLVGIGVSGLYAPSISTVARWFIKRRGLMTGIVASGMGIGTVIIPPVASRLVSSYGWRNSVSIVGSVTLILIVALVQFMKRDPSKIGQLPYGEDEVKPEHRVTGVRSLSLRRAIHHSQFWMLCIMLLCFGFGLETTMAHIVPHATDLGISAIAAANLLATVGGTSVAGRIVMGSAGDRFGTKPAFIISFILPSVVFLWLLVAKELWMLYLFAAIFGFSYGSVITLMPLSVANLFGLRSHGIIYGTVIFGMAIGETCGPIISGGIFDIAGSYYFAFLTCAILNIIGLALASFLRPTRIKEELSID